MTEIGYNRKGSLFSDYCGNIICLRDDPKRVRIDRFIQLQKVIEEYR